MEIQKTTHRGRKVRKPSRFLRMNRPEAYSSKEGEVVRRDAHVRDMSREHEE